MHVPIQLVPEDEMEHDPIASPLPRTPATDPTLALLEVWGQEDATGNPTEIAAQEREFQQGISPDLSLRTLGPWRWQETGTEPFR